MESVALSEQEFSVLVKGMKSIYAQPTFIPDETAYKMWYRLLCDLDYKTLEASIMKHMTTSKFPPTPADIREGAASVSNTERELTELEAWHLVRRAISNSNYNSEEEYAKLPPVIQKAVGHPSNLREWAQMDTKEVDTVQEALFARNYTAAIKREKELRQMNPQLRKLLEHTAERLYIPEAKEPAPAIEQKESAPMPDWVKERIAEMSGKEKNNV